MIPIPVSAARLALAAAACLAPLAWPQPAQAQAAAPVVYPSKGQTPQQQDRDRFECHDWARAQSGHDPARAGSSSPGSTTGATPSDAGSSGAMARGAAGGAAVAELSGKNTGHGAATGLVGAGLMQKMKAKQAAEQQKQRQQAVADQARATYGRAFAACLEGRGYVVK